MAERSGRASRPPRPTTFKERHPDARRFSGILSETDWESLELISDHWKTNRIDAVRTMIRYFEVNLGLRKK